MVARPDKDSEKCEYNDDLRMASRNTRLACHEVKWRRYLYLDAIKSLDVSSESEFNGRTYLQLSCRSTVKNSRVDVDDRNT